MNGDFKRNFSKIQDIRVGTGYYFIIFNILYKMVVSDFLKDIDVGKRKSSYLNRLLI